MKTLTLILLLLLSSPVYSQAVWNGRTYDHPVCSNPNCRMCNSIRSQLYSQPRPQPQVYFKAIPQLVPQLIPKYLPAAPAAEEPTPHELIPLIFELVPLTENDIFIDIGCGDGRILKEASKSGCFSIGIELNPELAAQASKLPNVKIINKNALDYDYSIATVVYMYLYPDLMEKIIPKLRPGTVVVSYSHTTPSMTWRRFGNFYVGTR